MTAVLWKLALALTALLAAATAAADVVITADEVIDCMEVEPAASDSVGFTLPRLEQRTLSTFDIYEVRLVESSRVAELSARLPQSRVVLDAGQPVSAPEVRDREMLPLRESLGRRPTGHAVTLDTLYPAATPEEMMAACGVMDSLLRNHERNDTAAASLLREVRNEQTALRGMWPSQRTRLLSGGCGTLGMAAGTWLGWTKGPPQCVPPLPYTAPGTGSTECGIAPGTCVIGTAPVGCLVGSVLGYALGACTGAWLREEALKEHRNRVNELVRRINRVVASVR